MLAELVSVNPSCLHVAVACLYSELLGVSCFRSIACLFHLGIMFYFWPILHYDNNMSASVKFGVVVYA